MSILDRQEKPDLKRVMGLSEYLRYQGITFEELRELPVSDRSDLVNAARVEMKREGIALYEARVVANL